MTKYKDSFSPKNIVTVIQNNKIYLENVSAEMLECIIKIGAKTSQKAHGQVSIIECIDELELAEKMKALNEMGFLFVGEPAGWPPSAMFDYLREKNLLKGRFKEITWRGQGEWIINEK